MNNPILTRLKKYYAKRSVSGIIIDILFYFFILTMLIPSTRKIISTGINRVVMHRPKIPDHSELISLDDKDYQWTLSDLDGSTIQFSDLEGQVIFLNFWATWCPPCLAEMPGIQRLYDDFHDRVHFVLISQEDPEKLKGFLTNKGYKMPVYRARIAPPEVFKTTSVPTTFLISTGREIVIKKTGAARWDDETFRQYLEKMINP